MLSCLTVSFSRGMLFSRGYRTPGSEKNQTSVYLIKRKMKKKILYFVYVQKEAATPTAAAAAPAPAPAVEKQKEKMPKLVKHTSHIHTLFRHRRQHNVPVRVLSHMRTGYFSEGSVQHPPSSKQAAAAAAAAAAVEEQVFCPTLIRVGAKDRHPCFVLRQSQSMSTRN